MIIHHPVKFNGSQQLTQIIDIYKDSQTNTKTDAYTPMKIIHVKKKTFCHARTKRLAVIASLSPF